MAAAETQVRAALGQMNTPDQIARRREYAHAVVALARAPACPQIAVDIAAKPVRRLLAIAREKDAAVREFASVDDVVDADAAWTWPGFHDVAAALVG